MLSISVSSLKNTETIVWPSVYIKVGYSEIKLLLNGVRNGGEGLSIVTCPEVTGQCNFSSTQYNLHLLAAKQKSLL